MHQVPNTVHFEFMLNLTDKSVVVLATREAFLHPNIQRKSQFPLVNVKNQRTSAPQTIFPFHLILNFFHLNLKIIFILHLLMENEI